MIILGKDTPQFLYHTIKATLKSEELNIEVLESIDSTNSYAKRYAAEACDRTPSLFVALEQSAGRGRVGRSFISRRDRGIYMTLLYFADDISDTVRVTTSAAVAVALSIEEITGKKMKIKWVNDIFDEYGKVSGILVEGVPCEIGYAVVIGVGINVGEGEFPEELIGIASSIGEIGSDRGRLISQIADRLLDIAKNPADTSYMEDYRARFMLRGKQVELIGVDGGARLGRVLGVEDDGGLIIEGDGGREVIRSGSVSVRIKENG